MTTSKQLTQTAPANADESAKQVVQSAAEGAQRMARAPMSTGSVLWDVERSADPFRGSAD